MELSPGERAVFELRAAPITSFHFEGELYNCGQSDVPVQFGDVSIEPSIDRQADSCPPYWLWDECVSATLRVPVDAAPDAGPGEYEYEFAVAISDGTESSTRNYTHSVTVS